MKIRTYKKPVLPEEKIFKNIKILRKIYVALILWVTLFTGIFLINLAMKNIANDIERVYGFEWLLALVLYVIIYLGLRKRTRWVIHLILIISALSIFGVSLRVLMPAENIGMIIYKLIDVLLLFFFIYQISFFRRKEVKDYFKTSGVAFYQ